MTFAVSAVFNQGKCFLQSTKLRFVSHYNDYIRDSAVKMMLMHAIFFVIALRIFYAIMWFWHFGLILHEEERFFKLNWNTLACHQGGGYTGTSKKKINMKKVNIFCHSFQKVKPIYYIESLLIEWNISSLYFLKFWWLWLTDNANPKFSVS